MMKVSIWYASELIEAEAGQTPVPGLVINREPGDSGLWCVTHARSGASVAKLPNPEAALHIAIKLGAAGDWTRAGTAITRSAPMKRKWAQIINESGSQCYMTGPAVPRALLREQEAGSGA